jgi:hypothetical protein
VTTLSLSPLSDDAFTSFFYLRHARSKLQLLRRYRTSDKLAAGRLPRNQVNEDETMGETDVQIRWWVML